jgi:hypothetical protein
MYEILLPQSGFVQTHSRLRIPMPWLTGTISQFSPLSFRHFGQVGYFSIERLNDELMPITSPTQGILLRDAIELS